MFESIILGAVQGIAEWLPVSSEAMIVLVKNNFFADGMLFSEMISFAIFLHLGTLLAVIAYYRKRIIELLQQLFRYTKLQKTEQQFINFIIMATAVSGGLGVLLLKIIEKYESWFHNEMVINIIVAVFLLITAMMLYISEQKKTNMTTAVLSPLRAIITGIFQGFAAVPGISRSGSTLAGMGILGIDKERALEISFLLSIPLVLFANIILNWDMFFSITCEHIIALVSAFVFGIITIDVLLRIVRKIRFSYFVGIFAFILLVFSFV
ncbi:MAG: undecaprenyl-diphosphate phosphatase [Minisyncoccia bacterium]